MVTKGKELTVVDPSSFAVLAADPSLVREVLAENLGGGQFSPFDLDQVHVPGAGGTTWEIPTIEGTEEIKTLDGVIVYWRDGRSFWRTSFDEKGGGNPPDCYSVDGVIGIGDPGGDCRTCPMAQFGSAATVFNRAGSQAQACRATRMLLVVRQGDLLPLVVSVPPSSLKPIKQYFIQLSRVGLPYYGVISRFTLNKTKSGGGIAYAEIQPTMIGKLSPEQAARMKTYNEQLRPAIEGVAYEPDNGIRYTPEGEMVRVDTTTGEVIG